MIFDKCLKLNRLVLAASIFTGAAAAMAEPTAEQWARYQQYQALPTLIEGGNITPNWAFDKNSFWYAEGTPDNRVIQYVDPANNTVSPLFDVPRLRAALKAVLGYEPPHQGVPFSQLAFVGPKQVQFTVEGRQLTLDLADYSILPVAPMGVPVSMLSRISKPERVTPKTYMEETHRLVGAMANVERLSSDGKFFLSLKDNNVWLRATIDGREFPLTEDGSEADGWKLESGQWDPWSPDGQKLVVLKVDSSQVVRVPQVHLLQQSEQVEWIRGVKTGTPLQRTEVYLLDVYGNKPLKVDLGDTTDHYIKVYSWLPDSSEVILGLYSRDMKRVDIVAANANTGKIRTLMTETADTFVKVQHDVLYKMSEDDFGFNLLADGKHFIWESNRDGWNHLYLYSIEGKLVRQLTKGDFPVIDVVQVDDANGWVYFTAHAEERLYDTHLYRVSLQGRNFKRLTEGKGIHNVAFSPSKQFFVDNYSNVDVVPHSVLRKVDGTLLRELDKADISKLEAVGWTMSREFVVKAADGVTDLWGHMFLPADFDPTKKYPVVEYIYGGAQLPMAQWFRPFAAAAQQKALAQLGFIVISMEGRGTPERSKAFHDVVYGNWGRNEILDHAGAIKQLAKRHSFIDIDRVGIYGASWGGYYSTRALFQAPDVYKVAVAQVPAQSPWQHILYEPYLGLPSPETKAAYEYADNTQHAAKLKGKLMMISGLTDHATVWDLLRMSYALVEAGIDHEQVIVPDQGHGFFDKGAAYQEKKTVNYFLENLQ